MTVPLPSRSVPETRFAIADPLCISTADVDSAAALIDGVAILTPLLPVPALDRDGRGPILVKFEGAQHTGSFKFRGAYNRLARIPVADRGKGVVAWSSGNHAQGVAAAARLLGMPATIVMPADAPAVKYRNTIALGAEVVSYDRLTESREEIATALAEARGAVLVPSFDDPHIIAGQGTIGLEILSQAAALGQRIARVLCCCGGGGLISGLATALKAADPAIEIYAVEPENFDDTARSLASGTRQSNPAGARSICDALLAPTPGTLTFPINRALLSGGLSVSDAEVEAAMRFAFDHMKLVAEPGGAVALAAAIRDDLPDVEGATVVIVSGGNVDPAHYAAILADRGEE